MGLAEIDGRDPRRSRREVREDVAAARGDRHDMAVRPECQRLEVDLRVFPDLRVDEATEQPFEDVLQESLARQDATAADRLFQADIALIPRIGQPNDSRSTQPAKCIHPRCQFDDRRALDGMSG